MFEGISKKVLNTNDCVKISLWFPKLVLNSVCMWPGQINDILQGFAFWLIMAICTFIEYGLFSFIVNNFKSFDESFTTITCFSTTMQVIVKGSIFYYYINTTKRILNVVLYKFWPSNLVGKKVENSLSSYCRIYLIGMMFFYFLGSFFSFVFMLTPFFKVTRETPYNTVYPFDYSSSPKFEIMYLMQCFTNFYIVLGVVVGVDILFMAVCCNITAQYRLLKSALLKLGTEEVKELNCKLSQLFAESDTFEKSMSEEKKFFNRCINHHQLLLRTMEDVEIVYSVIGFFQLGFSIVAICLSSFVLTTENVEFNQLVNITLFISANIVELFYYCSVATEVDFEMDNLSQGIFSSYWYQTDYVKLRQDILFTIKKSQNVKKIKALKLFPLNYDTFIQILRISFSFHTVLSNIAVR
nr:odorant receptor 11 [Monochamus saltuarius]